MNNKDLINIKYKIEEAKKALYKHRYSNVVFDSISPLWFINKQTSRSLLRIATFYVFSLFSLSYLKLLTTQLKNKYKIKDFGSTDIINNEKISSFSKEIQNLFDEDIVRWTYSECIPTLEYITKKLNVSSYEDFAKLLSLLQNELDVLEQSIEEEHFELLIYDAFYTIFEKLTNFGYISILDNKFFDSIKTFDMVNPGIVQKIQVAKKILTDNDRKKITLSLVHGYVLEQEVKTELPFKREVTDE